MGLKVYRVWIDPGIGEVCCVLAAAPNAERAIELAREQAAGFEELESAFTNDGVKAQEFDIGTERASIC